MNGNTYLLKLKMIQMKKIPTRRCTGCGEHFPKSELFRVVRSPEGEITLDGVDIYKDMDVNILRKRVGMVFQKPNPFPMSIYDNIAFGPRTHGMKSKAKLDDIVEKSLRDAAIWEEVKDRLKKSNLPFMFHFIIPLYRRFLIQYQLEYLL